jgi:murein L,D-transpeptidase YafK
MSTKDTIRYFIEKETPLYKDSSWKEVFTKMPAWTFLRESFINEKESTDNLLCIEIKGKKVWIEKTALTDNTVDTSNDFFKPTTEKVIIVDKSARKMIVYDQFWKHQVKELKIALSPRWEGDKTISGDWNTPEGKYYICLKNPASSFWRNPKTGWKLGSLMVSYPNTQDAIEGLIAGDINGNEYTWIKSAIRSKQTPNQNTKLWNYIMIHGWGSQSDWTIWCMALNNEDMLWLYGFMNTGADLFIK